MIDRLRIPAAAACAALIGALAAAWLVPQSYVARASLLLPKSGGESRVLRLEESAGDPSTAVARVRTLLAGHKEARMLDAPSVLPARRDPLAWGWAAALAGGILGLALVLRRELRRRPVRHERELVAALGEPLLAAHPTSQPALRALSRQLAEHWFGARRLLPVVALDGEGGATLACELARTFAGAGCRTLLVDADLRAPQLHGRFRVAKGKGLADGLDGLDVRDLRLVPCGENLALLTAGRRREDPLELLSRARLHRLLAAAAQPFDVVLVCPPPVARGPDFEIFAALAGGVLVFAGAQADAAALAALRVRLGRCRARVVGTVLERG
jgi:Mrp family chromosome partitioning ATPase